MNSNLLKKAGAVLLALAVWQAVAMCVHQDILLVTPVQVARRLLTIWQEQNFFPSLWFTFRHITTGFLLGVLLGASLAFAASKIKFLETLLWPWMATIKSVPVASFVVICLIWLSSKNLSIFISFLVVVPVIYNNILSGIKNIDPKMIEMAKVFRIPFAARFRCITLPALKNFVIPALSLTAGMSWKAGVAAEVIGIPNGSIGKALYNSKIWLDTDDLLAWTVVIVIISILFEKLFMLIVKKGLYAAVKCPEKGRVKGNSSGRTKEKETAVSLRSVSKSYSGKVIFENYSAEYPAGETTVLSQPSGWGKTTLARMIMGLESPDSGEILFFTRPSCAGHEEKNNEDPAWSSGSPENRDSIIISAVFQEDLLCEGSSPLVNVMIAASDDITAEHARSALTSVGLDSCMDQPVSELSGGMRRRAALIRALLAPSDLVILDEPFNSLDKESKELAAAFLLKELNGRSCILITHRQ